MADTKISALPAATTPVAGSEVLPIVQSGTTTKVSIDNLTTGKNVPMLGVAATGLSALGSALNANWASASKGAQLGTYGALYQLEVDATVALASNALVSNATTGATKYIASAAASRVSAGVGTLSLDIALAGTAGAVIGANWASALSTNTTYNVTLPSGNLVIGTSGKGIDFSVNPAAPGVTSELLNDYEQGTWTPTQGAGLTVVGAFTSDGTYTKVGRIVTIRGNVFGATSVACTSAGVICGGLPFAVFVDTAGSYFNGTLAAGGAVDANSTNINAIGPIAATTGIYFSATYQI
jgi:hypothetical protein